MSKIAKKKTKKETSDTVPEAKPSLSQIAEEHKALGDSVARLEKTTDPHQILPRLEKLKSQLEHHFESEEGSDGVRDDIESHAPYLLPSLQKIFEEHREFLAEIDALKAKTEALVEGPVAEVLHDTVGLMRRLRDHEARESELLSDVYYTDYGTGAD